MKAWGLDLQRMGEKDRKSRNIASYRPTRLNGHAKRQANVSLAFLNQFWHLLEPSPDSRFRNIDRYLLRIALEKAHKALGGNKTIFKKRIEKMLSALFNSSELIAEWKQFLLRKKDKDNPQTLNLAHKNEDESTVTHHFQVLSRALLLLRVSTGANSLLLKRTGITKSKLRFWWQTVGEENGLWDKHTVPYEFVDLWADIEEVLMSTEAITALNNDSDFSFYNWKNIRLDSIRELGSCERVALWGLGL